MPTFVGTSAGETIFGTSDADLLEGLGGDDRLFGLEGNDTTDGGLGDDLHFIDSAGDIVVERAAEGDDRVIASVSYTLTAGAHVEVLGTANAASTAALDLRGNELGNSLYGNVGNNVLMGGDGDDYLVGLAGNDLLDGEQGADTMAGGAGDDTYYVYNLDDRVIETAGEGFDQVITFVDYALAPGAEVEVLYAAVQFTSGVTMLAGNEFAQTIYGNGLDNILFGEGGADVLSGGGGQDIYHISDGREQIVETGSGEVYVSTDYVLNAGASIQSISTYWIYSGEAFDITGNEFGQTIIGNAGTNILDGKGGHDRLIGLEGADTYAFTTALGAGNIDQIIQFSSGVDTIALDDAIFTALSPGGLPAGAFAVGTAATEADDRIIYDAATGRLYYDADGAGASAAIQFAMLQGAPTVSPGDFVVI